MTRRTSPASSRRRPPPPRRQRRPPWARSPGLPLADARPRIIVAGLGPADATLLTAACLDAIATTSAQFLRTTRHPAASAAPAAQSFDHVYDAAASLDEVYPAIVDLLVDAADKSPDHTVLYLVPGSPSVAERTVELLRGDSRIELTVLPALSFLDLAWDRLTVDPLAAGVRLVDGHRFAEEAAGERGPLLVAQCDSALVMSQIKLAVEGEVTPDDVIVLQRLGLPDESVTTVAWDELDRTVTPDHLTSIYIPALAEPVGFELVRFAELVRTLRERCPWDQEQTHRTLTRHLLEETYEVLEAIESGDPVHLEEELGDLLFQVYFHATLGAEQGEFTLADVARGIHDKLVRRHPHVFGDVSAETSERVMSNWEQIKKEEKGRTSMMDGIPGDLPSLLYAHKVQRKAASVGFDWDSVEGAYPKVTEELAELKAEPSDDELGDLLFAVVNVARHLKIDPETALRGATAKFRDRFMTVERLAGERGIDMTTADLAALDRLWDEAKAAEA